MMQRAALGWNFSLFKLPAVGASVFGEPDLGGEVRECRYGRGVVISSYLWTFTWSQLRRRPRPYHAPLEAPVLCLTWITLLLLALVEAQTINSITVL